ncbi:MAG TPA: hypothetical protein VI796_03580 [Candidatus Thermoplasmatota archaeon]|nr:hypothetical protein [Candidatus Thermoplasmatota archaeon]
MANGTATGYATGDPVFKTEPAKPAGEAAPAKVLDAAKALVELASTSLAQIERATALTWGGRALASYQLSGSQTSLVERMRRFHEGEAFRQEAFEHASMAEDHGVLLAGIQLELDAERLAVQQILQGTAGT